MALLLLAAFSAKSLVRSPSAMGLLHCAANGTRSDATVLAMGWDGASFAAPTAGVVTGWRVYGGSDRGQLEQRLQVFRPVDSPVSSFFAVAESSAEVVPDGTGRLFKVRIPVESGDLFALRGTTKTSVCNGAIGFASGLHEGPTSIGSTYEFKLEKGLGAPLDVAVEPDEDGDGYGDRTQDRCPREPTTQDGCPAVDLRVEEAVVKASSILVRVTAGADAEALAVGKIRVQFRLPGSDTGVPLTTSMRGGVERVLPGRATRLKLELPKIVLRQLAKMAPGRSLKAWITVRAVSIAGRKAARRAIVRLPGRKRA